MTGKGFKRKALTLFIGALTYAGFTLYQSSRLTTNITKYFLASTSTLESAASPSASNIQHPTLASNSSLADDVDALVHGTGGPLLLALNSPRKFISYKLVKDLLFLNVYDPLLVECANHIFTEPFKEPGVMDFHTSIDTNLNIMFVGDSVSTQFAQLLQEATHPIKRQTIRYGWKNYEGSHIAVTPANGTVASIRVTGLMLNKTRDKARWMAPKGGGGWYASDIRELKRLIHQWRPVHSNVGYSRQEVSFCERQQESVNMSNTSSTDEYSCEQDDFDVVVHQFSVSHEQMSYYNHIQFSTSF
jgi:NACalpha-BTF3-like transcription factor